MSKFDRYISLNKPQGNTFDWGTFLLTMLLLGIGLLCVYSSTYNTSLSEFFTKQVLYTGICVGVMFVMIYIPEHWLQIYSFMIYWLVNILLLIVLWFGVVVYGTKGWLNIAGNTFQPSEIAKLSTLLFLARFLSHKGRDVRTLRDFAVVSFFFFIPSFLIVIEPDYGTVTVLVAMLLGVLLWTGFDLFYIFFVVSLPVVFILSLLGSVYFFLSALIFSVIAITFRRKVVLTAMSIGIIITIGYASPIIINKVLPHQKNRIETFLNPGSDPKGKGYNVIQSIMAVGSGGLTGTGYMQGTQTQLRYIPKQWTDFIFTVPTEEFGFVGGVVILGLLTLLILRIIRISLEVDSPFFSIIGIGSATLIFYHTVVNIGMVIGLMPVMGIPLPFLSAGGSSLLVNMSLIGLVMNAYRSHRKFNF